MIIEIEKRNASTFDGKSIYILKIDRMNNKGIFVMVRTNKKHIILLYPVSTMQRLIN